VDFPVLKIVGLDPKSRLIPGDFENRMASSTTLASRDAIAKTPPCEVSRRLARIPGESRDSGLGLSLDGMAIHRGFVALLSTIFRAV